MEAEQDRGSYQLMLSIVKKHLTPKEEEYEKINSFFLCRWLSNHPLGIEVANYINCNSELNIKGQYWLARSTLQSVKYIANQKKDALTIESIQLLAKHYKCNLELATRYLSILPTEELDKIRLIYSEGRLK